MKVWVSQTYPEAKGSSAIQLRWCWLPVFSTEHVSCRVKVFSSLFLPFFCNLFTKATPLHQGDLCSYQAAALCTCFHPYLPGWPERAFVLWQTAPPHEACWASRFQTSKGSGSLALSLWEKQCWSCLDQAGKALCTLGFFIQELKCPSTGAYHISRAYSQP